MAPFIGQKIRPKCRGQRSGRTVRMGQPCCSYIYYVLPEEGQHRANFDSKFIYVCTAAISSTSVKWLHASMLLLYNRVKKFKEVLLLNVKGGVDALVEGYTPKTTRTINSNAGTHLHISWVQHLHNCSHKTMYCSYYYVCCLNILMSHDPKRRRTHLLLCCIQYMCGILTISSGASPSSPPVVSRPAAPSPCCCCCCSSSCCRWSSAGLDCMRASPPSTSTALLLLSECTSSTTVLPGRSIRDRHVCCVVCCVGGVWCGGLMPLMLWFFAAVLSLKRGF